MRENYHHGAEYYVLIVSLSYPMSKVLRTNVRYKYEAITTEQNGCLG